MQSSGIPAADVFSSGVYFLISVVLITKKYSFFAHFLCVSGKSIL